MSRPTISRKTVVRTCKLAGLALGDNEMELALQQLDSVLEHIADLSGIDTDGVRATTHAAGIRCPLRSDDLAKTVQHDSVKASTISSETLKRIEATNGRIGAFVHIDSTETLASAAYLDRRIAAGEEPGPLTGVPVGIKDNLQTAGIPTTCGSRMLSGYVPSYDATLVTRLKEAGAIIIGKCNMDEFAMGSSNEHSAYGPVRNPWNLDRVSGGSSGGSAAAVAAGMIPLSIGTDTGGSIRQPASLCGVVGLKPTYGRVSRYGLVAFASSLDTPGPLCRTARDAALALGVIAGHDPHDSTSAHIPVPDYIAAIDSGINGKRIGVPVEYFGRGVHQEVEDTVRRAIHVLEDLGAIVEEISLPHTRYAVATYYIIANAEASSNLARYDGMRYGLRVNGNDPALAVALTRAKGFGAEVKRRILLGTFVLSSGYFDAYYSKAQRVRTLVTRDFTRAFDTGMDFIVTPTSPFTAFALCEKVNDPIAMYRADVCTLPASLAGLPAVSVPCGFSGEGLPIGMQIVGRSMMETDLLAAAEAYQQATHWHERRPPGFDREASP